MNKKVVTTGIVVIAVVAYALFYMWDNAEKDVFNPNPSTIAVGAKTIEVHAQEYPDLYITRRAMVFDIVIPLLSQHSPCGSIHLLDAHVSISYNCKQSDTYTVEVTQGEKHLSVGDAASMISIIYDLTDKQELSTEEGIQVLAGHIIMPYNRYLLEVPISKMALDELIQNVIEKQYYSIPEDWVSYTNQKLGFSVSHPPNFRVYYDTGSDALRFQRKENNNWSTVWSVWRNSQTILKFSTKDGVLAHIYPDDLQLHEQKTITEFLVYVSGQFADLAIVRVDGDREEPWELTILFIDDGDYMFEITNEQSNMEMFEQFFRSFTLFPA